MTDSASSDTPLQRTPLHGLHLRLGARMVPFAGYELPVSYTGVIAEHQQCRNSAALFDVSHMGQIKLVGDGAAAALEKLVPVDVIGLAPGRQRYAFFTNASGGILDDLMIANPHPEAGLGSLFLVVNAACKKADLQHLQTHIGHLCTVVDLPERALLALQGPKAVTALSRLNPAAAKMAFMDAQPMEIAGAPCHVSRSGYTGEDGYEISMAAEAAEHVAQALLRQPEVKPAGLGARDTLRLEAGLCLYGHDLNESISPIEAGLTWAIQKVRRAGCERAGGYPGAPVIDKQLQTQPPSRRVGLVGLERIPVREGAVLTDAHGKKLGHVTSGTIGPTLNQPIAMAYLTLNHGVSHHEVYADVRGKRYPMRVTAMPFTPHRYQR
jgi:aminomethyltransferase